jgi:hypothetical protein
MRRVSSSRLCSSGPLEARQENRRVADELYLMALWQDRQLGDADMRRLLDEE